MVVQVLIVGHYHTHPRNGDLSNDDKNFTKGVFAGIDHYYYLQRNYIYEYDRNGYVKNGTEKINCKKNPESINCN